MGTGSGTSILLRNELSSVYSELNQFSYLALQMKIQLNCMQVDIEIEIWL